ncbi:hypothetical protein Tco_0324898 [Tanacetum coccineum]
MTTLAEFMIIAGADNHPPMLEKSLYESWKSSMELYIENRENRRMILSSLQNGPLVWLTVEKDGTTRTKKYEELSVAEKLQADCDLKATNIVLQGLPPDVYAIVNHHKVSKEIWDRVKLLMQDIKLSLQEKECKLYDEFDKFSFVKGETLYHLPQEWGKFVTDVKLARDLHTTKYDQLYSYLEQHEAQANETRLMPEQYQDPLASCCSCLNKAMAFLTAVASSRFPSTNNQLRTSSNSRNKAIIQDGRVTVQQIQGRQGQRYAGNSYKGHMARQCTQPKRPRNVTWFKEKEMLAEAHEVGQILDEEHLAFLADPGILDVLMANLSNYGSDVISEHFEQIPVADFTDNEITSDSNIIPYSQYLQETQQAVVQDTNVYAQKDAMILSTSHPNTDQSALSPVKIEAPRELPKVSLVNTSLKKLKYHLGQFDTVVKKRITPDAITEGEWGFEHTKAVFLKEIIPFLKTLKDIFNVFDKYLLNEVKEVQTVFNQMEAAIQ